MIERTLEDIITHVERELYQAAGPSVQLYSQDLIAQKVYDAYIVLATDPVVKWKRFRVFNQYTLDGVTGRTTVPIKNTFLTYGDIVRIFPINAVRPLTLLGSTDNPFLIRGTTPQNYITDTADVVRVVPFTATGDIAVTGSRYSLGAFSLNTVVPFDYLAISYYVCWQYCVDDASNPAMCEKFRQLFESRHKQLATKDANEPIALNGMSAQIPGQWFTDPY